MSKPEETKPTVQSKSINGGEKSPPAHYGKKMAAKKVARKKDRIGKK